MEGTHRRWYDSTRIILVMGSIIGVLLSLIGGLAWGMMNETKAKVEKVEKAQERDIQWREEVMRRFDKLERLVEGRQP